MTRETELAGARLFGDDKRSARTPKLGLPQDFPLEPFWPDGIRRDQERARESLVLIKQNPLWYAGVMLKRMWGMWKVAGEPLPYYGTAGINVTSEKCLPPERRGGAIGLLVNLLVWPRASPVLLLPLAAFGPLWLLTPRFL